jgi:DinB superfamily
MSSSDLLMDAFERIRDAVHPAVNGLSSEELAFRLDAETNSIAWLVWHLTRIQDDHVAELAGSAQIWTENGWVDRFGLPLDTTDTGYGHGPDESAKVVADSPLLLGYFEDVHEKSLAFVASLDETDLARVVDPR